MKKLAGLSVVIALVLVMYFIMGGIVKNTLNKNIDSIPQSPLFSIHLTDYKKGWFSSQASLVFITNTPPGTILKDGVNQATPAMNLNFNFPLIINHGPFIMTDSGLQFGIGQATTSPQSHYKVLVNYLNHTVIKYTLPAVAMKADFGPNKSDKAEFIWSGLSTVLSVSPTLDNLEGHMKLYGFDGIIDDYIFRLSEASANFKLLFTPDGLWLGQTDFSLPLVQFSSKKQPAFEFKAFNFMIRSDMAGDGVNLDLDLSLQNAVIDNKAYGPGVLKFSIKNLNPKAMANINKLQLKMMQGKQNSEIPALALIAELPNLLSNGSEFELSQLNFTLPEGKIEGNFKVSLPKSNNTAELAQKAHGEGHFKIPKTVMREIMLSSMGGTVKQPTIPAQQVATPTAPPVDAAAQTQKQVDQLLEKASSKGLLKSEGSDYVINFKLENQQVLINGQVYTPAILE